MPAYPVLKNLQVTGVPDDFQLGGYRGYRDPNYIPQVKPAYEEIAPGFSQGARVYQDYSPLWNELLPQMDYHQFVHNNPDQQLDGEFVGMQASFADPNFTGMLLAQQMAEDQIEYEDKSHPIKDRESLEQLLQEYIQGQLMDAKQMNAIKAEAARLRANGASEYEIRQYIQELTEQQMFMGNSHQYSLQQNAIMDYFGIDPNAPPPEPPDTQTPNPPEPVPPSAIPTPPPMPPLPVSRPPPPGAPPPPPPPPGSRMDYRLQYNQMAADYYASQEAPLRLPADMADELTSRIAAQRQSSGVGTNASRMYAMGNVNTDFGPVYDMPANFYALADQYGLPPATTRTPSLTPSLISGTAPSSAAAAAGIPLPASSVSSSASTPASTAASSEGSGGSGSALTAPPSQASSPPASVAGEPPTESAVASAATTQVGQRMDINRVVENVFPARYPDDIGKKATLLPPFTAFISGISQRAPRGTMYVTVPITNLPAGKFPYVSLQNFISWAKGDSEYNYQDQNRAVSNQSISQVALTTKITQLWSQVTPKGRKPAAAKSGPKASTSGS